MSRKTARDYAYKLVFEYLFNQESTDDTMKEMFDYDMSLTDSDKAYISSVISSVKEHFDEIKEYISGFTANFALERMYKPDLAVLILAVTEMKYIKDIPESVSIYEAVELIKQYSTEKSYKYVNGVLGAISKDMNKEKNE